VSSSVQSSRSAQQRTARRVVSSVHPAGLTATVLLLPPTVYAPPLHVVDDQTRRPSNPQPDPAVASFMTSARVHSRPPSPAQSARASSSVALVTHTLDVGDTNDVPQTSVCPRWKFQGNAVLTTSIRSPHDSALRLTHAGDGSCGAGG
jgi:hypothetical protein